MRRVWLPQLVASVLLLWALNPENPYSYYIFLRWVCCGVFVYLAQLAFSQNKILFAVILGVVALVYNPIIRLHLTRDIWEIINVVTILIAGVSVLTVKRNHKV